MRPEDVRYSETHEWVRFDPQTSEATVGITDYAVQQLSDLVHIELPKTGDAVELGTPFGEIESVKTVADLVAPVGGKIREVNREVEQDVEILKEDAYQRGWLIKVALQNPDEVQALMTKKEYEDFLQTLEHDEEVEDEGAA